MHKLTRTLDCPHLHEHDSRSHLQGCILSDQSLQSLPNCHFPLKHCEQLGLDGCTALSASTPFPLKQKGNSSTITERDKISKQAPLSLEYRSKCHKNKLKIWHPELLFPGEHFSGSWGKTVQ